MMPRWLIIADDLTGAADCAIAFAKQGQESVVAWGKHRDARGIAVLSVDTGTRSLPPGRAAERQIEVLASRYAPGLHLYKKIDSTLRGQPVAELVALLSFKPAQTAGRPRLAIVAPAFPSTGCITQRGRVVVQGTPLEETLLWARDHTYSSACLPEILRSVGLYAELLSLETIAKGSEAVTAQLVDARKKGVAAVVCDALVQADLSTIAAGSLPLSDEVIWVGSAGLASALAALDEGPARSPKAQLTQGDHRTVLIVVGSLAEASRLQTKALVQTGKVRHVVVSPDTLFAGAGATAWQQCRRKLSEELAIGSDVLLELELVANPDLTRGIMLSEKLAEFVNKTGDFGALVATGGDTVYALLSKLGVHSIRLLDEVEPGVPIGITLGAVSIPVVTKAGAFGNAHTLLRCLERLQK